MSSLPDLLDRQQSDTVLHLLQDLRIEVLSCRYQRMRQAVIVHWPRRLPDTLLYLPVDGDVDYRLGSRQGRIAPGDLLLIPDSAPHGMVCADGRADSAAFALHVQLNILPGHPQLDLQAIAVTRLTDPARLTSRLGLLTHLLNTAPRAAQVYGEQLIRQFLIDHVLAGAPLQAGFEPVDPRITETLALIAQRPGQAFTVAELARRQGLSLSRFRVLFRAATGIGPKQYLIQHRLGQVRRLLLSEPDMTIEEVAAATEFQNGPQLHKAFRQVYGVTPAAFRADA